MTLLSIDGLRPCPHCGMTNGLSILPLDEDGCMLTREGYDDCCDCCRMEGEDAPTYDRYLTEWAESWGIHCSFCNAGVENQSRSAARDIWNQRAGE